jgi:TolA-binding protein
MKTFLRKKLVATLLGTTIFVSTSAVVAETAYVSDTLRVGVRPAPDSQVAPTGVIKTGMLLEILESTGDYVRVRTEDDLEGWVRDIYVVNTPPAMIKLQTLQQQHHKLEGKLTILEKNNQELLEANQIMSRRLDQLSAERAKWQLSQARAALTNNEFSWLWWLLGILILIGAGFYSGISWYRQSVTKRLGGLRI